MVIAWIHLLLLCLPSLLFSAEFIASVSRNEVGMGEGFTLELTLKDASAKNPPSVEALKQVFSIHSQQSVSKMRFDGKASSSLTWVFTLVPHVVGDVQIPSISVESSEGALQTQPIAMRITREKRPPEKHPEEDIRFETDASNLTPYKNEPFFFTVRVTSPRTLTNLQVEKFEVEGAIVELAGEPKAGEKVENGMKVGLVEFKYLITPMKAGPLHIPSITVHGAIPQKRNSRSTFDTRSLLDDSFDPFALIQGFSSLQPFALSTKPLELDIRPPMSGLVPWLPAKALDIRESWDDSQVVREGEVFTRSFVIEAVGMHSSQLFSLEGKQDPEGRFKIYADQPELKDKITHGQLKSYRKEQYTLIPQMTGEWTLPEIIVGWWDTEKGEKREARIPARRLQILPALVSPVASDEKITAVDEARETPSPVASTHPLVYFVIGVLAALLVATLVLLILMQRKMKQLQQVPVEKKIKAPKEPKKVLLPVLRKIKGKLFRRRTKEKLEDLNPT